MIKWNEKKREKIERGGGKGKEKGAKKGGGEKEKKKSGTGVWPRHNNICITTLYIFMM